jgi:Aldehyde dehydrogenase family
VEALAKKPSGKLLKRLLREKSVPNSALLAETESTPKTESTPNPALSERNSLLVYKGRIARGVQTGQLDINRGRYNPVAPFGGYKRSGIGRELGRAGFEEYLQTKSLQLPA